MIRFRALPIGASTASTASGRAQVGRQPVAHFERAVIVK